MTFTDPAEKITTSFGGMTFVAGRRTAAHLARTQQQLTKAHPGARIVVIQPCYNTGVELSKGTHDFDGVLDVRIDGLSWWEAQRFLRAHGWAAWFRHTGTWAAMARWHIHMISLGCPGPLGELIDGGLSQFGRIVATSQIADYYAHSLGLAGQHDPGEDTSWFPPDIDATIFDFAQWERELEDAMPYDDWPQASKDHMAADVAAKILGSAVDNKGTTVKTILGLMKRAANLIIKKFGA